MRRPFTKSRKARWAGLLLALALLTACSNQYVSREIPTDDGSTPNCFVITHEWSKGLTDYSEGIGTACIVDPEETND